MKNQKTRKKGGSFRYTLLALLAAVLVGAILRVIGNEQVIAAVDAYLLTPVKTMYLSSLKLVVTPVVFFMISSSVAGISDYKAYGRIGIKVISLYLMTSVAAICVGFGVSQTLHPGAGVVLDQSVAGYEAAEMEVSLVNTIVSIVPSNLLSPFLEGEMIQIIFLAILIGAASGILEQRSGIPQFRKGLGLLNQLFLTISGLVLRLIPVGTFAAVGLLVLTIDLSMILSLLKLVGCVFLGAGIMMCLYGLLFLLVTRKSPVRLLKKCLPNLTSFALLCSTSAVMPQTIETCNNKLGIDPEISAFSMPLGSTMNMDGACIYLTISALFLAELYGIDLTAGMLVKLGFTTLLLSVGAPPIPGAGFICLSVLVMQLGIPIDSIGFLLGIDQLMSMCRTVINGSGDITATAVIACTEGRMNMDVFSE